MRRSRRGMTLVELMVVVAILCVVMGVLTMGTLSQYASVDSYGSYEPFEVDAPRMTTEAGRVPPVIEAADISLVIRSRPMLDGLTVQTTYDSDITGVFTVTNPDDQSTEATLSFPFPEGVRNVSAVSMRVVDEAGERGRTRFALSGLTWQGVLHPAETVTVHLTYTAAGRDQLTLSLTDGPRAPMDVTVRAELQGAPDVRIPAGALAPTSVAPDVLDWEIDGLLSDADITIELPSSSSSAAHLAAFGWLAALGVLLFGAGFWYLSEGERPGRLDDFRLGGLLLLGLDYALFYGILVIVAPTIGPLPAAIAAAAVSWPLLTLHVARITDPRFAIRRALPLAIAVTAAMGALAWLDGERVLVLLAVAVVAVGVLTATFGSWMEVRAAHADAVLRAREAVHAAAALRERREALEHARRAARTVLDEASTLVAESPVGPERASAVRASEHLRTILTREAEDAEDIEAVHIETTRRTDALGPVVEALRTAGARSVEALYTAIGRMEDALDAASEAEVAARADVRHANDHRVEVDAWLAELLALRQEASGVRGRVADATGVRALAADARRLTRAIAEATARLEGAAERARDAAAVADGSAVHCPACGGAHPTGSHFCPGCGTARPIECPCGICGRVTRLPGHLLGELWGTAPLHCGGCGTGLIKPE